MSVACNYLNTSSAQLQQTAQSPDQIGVVPFMLSDIGEGIVEVVVKEWFVAVGDHVSQFDNICEVQSDKASVTITSRYDGVVTRLHCDVDQVARVGEVLVDIKLDDWVPESGQHQQREDTENLPPVEKSAVNMGEGRQRMLTTPAVRRLAAEHRVNLATVSGSGRDGRILKEDLLQHLGLLDTGTVTPDSPATSSVPSAPTALTDTVSEQLSDTPVTLSLTQRAMFAAMTSALSVPHFSYCDEFDLSALMATRDSINQHVSAANPLSGASFSSRITLLPFVLKACSLALQHFPVINSWLHSEQQQQLIHKRSHDFGIAVDAPAGLLVPCIRHVQQLSVKDLSERVQQLQSLAASGSLSPADLTTPTFTVSNIGSVGGTYASAVIVPPQVAIVAVGRARLEPRYSPDGSLRPVHVAAFSWSADHRVVDGATLARFSNTVKTYLEHPSTMLFHLK